MTLVPGDVLTIGRDTALRRRLPEHADHLIVCLAPASRRGEDASRYPVMARAAAALAGSLRTRSVVYVSSTGIYDRQDGSEVDESSPVLSSSMRVRALRDAETAILAAADDRCSVRVLRVAGLYGPDRDPAARFRQAFADEHWCNFAWRDDVVGAIAHLLRTPPHTARATFNCADGRPVRASTLAMALAGARTHASGEAHGDASGDAAPRAAEQTASDDRNRHRSNQRVRTDALRATGWIPSVPSVFAGLRLLGHDVADPGLAGSRPIES